MRYSGKLKKWSTERGFGFIVADESGQDVFVHITAFARDGRLPEVGERLSFEVEPDGKDKRSAVRVRRPGDEPLAVRPPPKSGPRHTSSSHRKTSMGSRVIVFCLLLALGLYAYNHYKKQTVQSATLSESQLTQPVPAPVLESEPPTPNSFKCDGRKVCSQMTSCQEAKLFLKNCPGVEMDGDSDGVPCETQWCK